jgi:hypothetical protein
MLVQLGSNEYHLNQSGANERIIQELSEEEARMVTGGGGSVTQAAKAIPAGAAKSFVIGAVGGLWGVPQLVKRFHGGGGSSSQVASASPAAGKVP